MKSLVKYIFTLCLFVVININAQNLNTNTKLYNEGIHSNFSENYSLIADSLINFGKTLLGKAYRSVIEGRVLDCSGYVSYIYSKQGIDLPRSSQDIGNIVNKIQLNDIKKGDLMFFKGRNISSSNVGHVSMIIGIYGDTIEMMHSCRRGILIEEYNTNKYYTSRFLFFGRLPIFINTSDTIINNTIDIIESNSDPITVDSIFLSLDYNDSSAFNNELNINDSISENIKIIGVGDIMLGTNYPKTSYLPPDDGKYLLEPVKNIIQSADIAFGNLEGVLLTDEGKVKKCSNPDVCYAFKMPDHYANYLVDAGFNLLSLANNHIRDFGEVGTFNTMNILDDADINYAGLEECPFVIFEKNNLKFGFAAFAPNFGTIRINDYNNAREIISHLDSLCDIVIVSIHAGAEGPTKNRITRKKEMFLGEDRGNPYEFVRLAIDAGADIVFGHGPHVTRAIDIYKDRFIAYSLGNFATYGRFNLSGPNGIAPIIEIETDKEGKFIKGRIYAIKQIGRGGPIIDDKNKVIDEIIKLTKEDIPETQISIDKDGVISRKP